MAKTNRRILLASRPSGWPKESDFRLDEAPITQPGDGEFLARTVYLSVDPYMRGRMNDRKSYMVPVKLGEVMTGGVVGKIVESRNPRFAVGEFISGLLGWQDYATSDGRDIRKLKTDLPVSTALGVLGMPGLTGYFGLLEIGRPKPGETVVVSGAAGAVGSLVGQIAKIKGCRAVGVVGTDEKLRHVVDELGFDAAYNYKGVSNHYEKLAKLCPNGIDVYFDNVGGPITDAVFGLINTGARISVCGQISQYNVEGMEQGPRLLWKLIEKQARAEGFLVFQFADRYREAFSQLEDWVRSGRVKYRETIVNGLENAPKAFLGMMHGENIGKQLVKVSEESE